MFGQRPNYSGFGLMGQQNTAPRDAAWNGLAQPLDASGARNPFEGITAPQMSPQQSVSAPTQSAPAQNPLASLGGQMAQQPQSAAQPAAMPFGLPMDAQRPLAPEKQGPDRSNVVQALLSRLSQSGGSFGGLF